MSDAPFGDLVPGSLPWSILGAGWTWALALLVGAAAVRIAGPGRRTDAPVVGPRAAMDPGELVALAVVGVPLQSLAWLALSAAGRLRPVAVIAVALAVTACAGWFAWRPVLRSLRDALDGLRSMLIARAPSPAPGGLPEQRLPWLGAAATWGILAGLGLSGLFALVPTAHYDDLVYHLGLPRQALILGSWPNLPNFHHAFMPAGWEINSVVTLSLGGGTGPQLANVVTLGLLAVVAVRLGRVLGASLSASTAAALALVCSPVFLSAGALAGNDLFVGLGLASGLERLLASRGRRVALTGLLAGAAWSAKYVALPGVLGLALAAAALRGGSAGSRARTAAVVLGLALLVGSPWTLRAAQLTGNPLHPAFQHALGGAQWSAESAAFLTQDSAKGAFPVRGLWAFPLSLRDLVLRSDRLGSPSGLDTWFLVLVLGGALVAWRSRPVLAAPLLMFAVTSWAGWCATSMMLRFALAWLVALVPFAALAFEALATLARRHVRARGVDLVLAAALVGLACALLAQGAVAHAQLYSSPWREVLFGSRQDALAQRMNLADAARDLARDLPEEARVLVVGEARLGLLPRRAVASTAIDRPAIGRYLERSMTPDDVTRSLLGDGFTDVLVNSRELRRFDAQYAFRRRLGEREAALLWAWFASLVPTRQWGDVTLLHLPGRPEH